MNGFTERIAAIAQPAFAPAAIHLAGTPAPTVLTSVQPGAAIVVADGTDWSAADMAALVRDTLQAFQPLAVGPPLRVQCILLCAHGLPAGIGRALPRLDYAAGNVQLALHLIDGRSDMVHNGASAAWVPPALLLRVWLTGEQTTIDTPAPRQLEGRATGAPAVTYVLLAAIVAVHLGGWLLGDYAPGLSILTLFGAQLNALVLELGQWWRPFTAMFLHANLIHLGMNSLALAQLGPTIETAFGWRRLLVIWFAAGLAGNWLFLWKGPLEVWSVGASGAIFGLFGALVVLGLRLRAAIRPGFWWQIALTLGINVYIGLAVPQINMWAHAGGFVAGLIWAAAMILTRPGAERRQAIAAAAVVTVALAVAAHLQL